MPHKTKQDTPAAAILNCDINEHGNRLYQCARHGEVHMLAKEDPIWRPISRITDNEKTITLSRMQAEATEDDYAKTNKWISQLLKLKCCKEKSL